MKIEARKLSEEMAGGSVRVVDVRTPLEYGEVHIEGAELMPLDRLEAGPLEGADCVLVCRSGKRAAQAHEKLTGVGCSRLRVLDGGMEAWESAGLPVKRGEKVMSLERQVRVATQDDRVFTRQPVQQPQRRLLLKRQVHRDAHHTSASEMRKPPSDTSQYFIEIEPAPLRSSTSRR